MKTSINTIKDKALKVAIETCEIFMDISSMVDVDPIHFKKIISNVCNTNKINFENDNSKFDFISFVINIISDKVPSIHSQVFPQVGMDSKGNWTHNASKWA